MLQLVRVADRAAERAEASARHVRAKAWRDRLTRKISARGRCPSKAAFSWVRGPVSWVPNPTGLESDNDSGPAEHDWDIEFSTLPENASALERSRIWSITDHASVAPLSDQATVEREAQSWAELWEEHNEYRSLASHIDAPPLPALLPSMLLRAAQSFPAGTGIGADNISPRAICRLSGEAIRCLCKLLVAMELLGAWASPLDLVLIVLLPKPDGGRRPIGLFPTIIRVWMRARIQIARDWECAHSRPCLYGGPSMGAQRASWLAAFAAEDAARADEYFAQSLLDLVKAFEMIPHRHIAVAAVKHGYSLWLLRLSLAAYRLPRAVGVEGVYSRLIIATRGITAGSGFATTELRVLLLDVIDSTYVLWPSIDLAVYVDDMSTYARGPSRHGVAVQVAQVTDHLVSSLQNRYQLEVSASKSYTVASSFKLARTVARASRTGKLTGKRAGKLLGAPLGGGRKRSVRALVKRMHDFRSKIPRVHALRRARVRTQYIVRSAGTPAVTYGIEITGVGNTHLQNMRSSIARAAAPEGGGKNPDLILLVLDADTGTLDPAFDAHVAPLRFWSLAIWEEWICINRLSTVLANVQNKLNASKSPWLVTTGPVAALLNSLARIGWSVLSCAKLRDDRGQIFDLRLDPPVVVCRAACASVRRWRLARVAHAFHGMDDFYDRVVTGPHQETLLLRNDVVDLSRCIRLTREGRTAACKKICGWSSTHASMLVSAISGGQWPQARLFSAKKFAVSDDLCQLCGQATGTLEHRYSCATTRPLAGWIESNPDAEQFISGLPDSQRLTLRTRGVLLRRLTLPEPAVEASLHWRIPWPDDIPEGSKVYIDASAMDATCKPLTRLGFAIVVVASSGELLALGYGCPPNWIVDSGGAETWAFYVVASLSPFLPRIVTDYLGILSTLRDGKDRAISAVRGTARLWKMVFSVLDSDDALRQAQHRVVWMPSHGSRSSIGGRLKSDGHPVSTVDWRANRLADAAAKAAAADGRVAASKRIAHHRACNAYEHALAELAAVTTAANRHAIQSVDSNGKIVTKIVRDSAALPRSKRIRRGSPVHHVPMPPPADPTPSLSVYGGSARTKRSARQPQSERPAKKRRMSREHAAHLDSLFECAWRVNRDARTFTPICEEYGCASVRLAALRARTLARISPCALPP